MLHLRYPRWAPTHNVVKCFFFGLTFFIKHKYTTLCHAMREKANLNDFICKTHFSSWGIIGRNR